MGGLCGHFSKYMGHLCLTKSYYMGGGYCCVQHSFIGNRLLTFDRYIEPNVPVSIKILNPNLLVFLLC